MKADARAAVKRFIADHKLIDPGDRVLVALSGGADSIALFHILISLKEELDVSIAAAHFNHGVRGAEADRDQAFVEALCEKQGIALFCEKADVPAMAAESGKSVELCGRNLRYRFLDKVARDLGGAKIATAHHLDDNAETVIWNLIRGSGIAGLSGIPVQRGSIIRPLLGTSRREIEDYCRENDLLYVTDSTNLSDDYTRNKLRHQVMPVLRELNPGVGESISHTASIMTDADRYLNKISIEELKATETAYGHDCKRLLNAEPIILQYAVKNLLQNDGAPVDFRHTALIIEAMRTNGAVDLGNGFTASCAQGILRIIPSESAADDFCVPLTDYVKTCGTRVSVRNGAISEVTPPLDLSSEKINNLLVNHGISCDIMTPDTVVRRRRAGDTFTDARRGVTKTLKKLMNELKIPRELRDTIPVVADGSTVLWIQGIGASAQAKADLTRDGDYYLIFGGQNNA